MGRLTGPEQMVEEFCSIMLAHLDLKARQSYRYASAARSFLVTEPGVRDWLVWLCSFFPTLLEPEREDSYMSDTGHPRYNGTQQWSVFCNAAIRWSVARYV